MKPPNFQIGHIEIVKSQDLGMFGGHFTVEKDEMKAGDECTYINKCFPKAKNDQKI